MDGNGGCVNRVVVLIFLLCMRYIIQVDRKWGEYDDVRGKHLPPLHEVFRN